MSAILEATAQVLVEDGYDKASTNRVAQRAGVSVGSLYQYFPNKEALVGELVDRYTHGIMDMVLEDFRNLASEPPEVVAPRLVRAMIETKRKDPKLARVLREQIPRVGRLQRYEEQLEQVVAATAAYLENHRARVRHEDVGMAAFVAVHTVDATTHAGVTTESADRDAALAEHVSDMVVAYLVGEH